MAKKNALVRSRGKSPALAKARDQLSKVRSKLSKTRREHEEARIPEAVMGAGAVLAGAAGTGFVRGLAAGTDAEAAVEPMAAAIMGTAGITLKQPYLILAAAGALAPWVADKADDMGARAMSTAREQIEGETAEDQAAA